MPQLLDLIRVPATHLLAVQTLRRLSASALVDLVCRWADETGPGSNPPIFDSTDPHASSLAYFTPAATPERLKEVYVSLLVSRATQKEIVERLVDVDWSHGLSLRQWAEADRRLMLDRPASARWSAFELAPVKDQHDAVFEKFASSLSESDRPWKQLEPAGLAAGIQKELASILTIHKYTVPPEDSSYPLMRFTVVTNEFSIDESTLRAAHGHDVSLKVVWLAYRPLEKQVLISPPTTVLDADSDAVETLVLRTLRRLVSIPSSRMMLLPREETHLSLGDITAATKRQNTKWLLGKTLAESSPISAPP